MIETEVSGAMTLSWGCISRWVAALVAWSATPASSLAVVAVAVRARLSRSEGVGRRRQISSLCSSRPINARVTGPDSLSLGNRKQADCPPVPCSLPPGAARPAVGNQRPPTNVCGPTLKRLEILDA